MNSISDYCQSITTFLIKNICGKVTSGYIRMSNVTFLYELKHGNRHKFGLDVLLPLSLHVTNPNKWFYASLVSLKVIKIIAVLDEFRKVYLKVKIKEKVKI